AVLFLERRPLAGDSLDQVSQAGGLVVVVGEREDVYLDRHGGFQRKFVLGKGSEDGLRADNDHGRVSDDLARRPKRMLELGASHRLASPRTSDRSCWLSSPPIGETSRICTESVSSPVITRRRLSRSPPRTKRCQRSRLRRCGCPRVCSRNRRRFRS